jgi:S1-C subfamily serine protease
MTRKISTLALVLACLATAPAAADGPAIESSVVRIVNHSQRGDWYTPWNTKAARQSTGSGFVIDGGRVMTNAHVASDTRMLLIYLHGDPEPHEARVLAIGHDCDLALLEPTEEGLLDDIPTLPLGEGFPDLLSTVETYGYPAGGKRLSITAGVVSRVEVSAYAHSAMDTHLTVQTDAAINPGNSGGPVLQGAHVVGVAFQGISRLDNVGFFIPAEVVHHFLDDVADEAYDGYPDLGVITATLENPAARARAGMGTELTGVRVEFVYPGASAEGHLSPGDVILEVEGHDVAGDGTVAVDDLRLTFGVLVDRKLKGEVLTLTRLRDGEPAEVAIPLGDHVYQRSRANVYDELPRYVVYAGLVFVELDREVMETFGADWFSKADRRLLYEFVYRPVEDPAPPETRCVLLLRRLDHPVNAQMAWYRNRIVSSVNGEPIHRLEDLVEQVQGHDGPHQVFEFEHFGCLGVLDREAASEAHPEILEQYAIAQDRRL